MSQGAVETIEATVAPRPRSTRSDGNAQHKSVPSDVKRDAYPNRPPVLALACILRSPYLHDAQEVERLLEYTRLLSVCERLNYAILLIAYTVPLHDLTFRLRPLTSRDSFFSALSASQGAYLVERGKWAFFATM